MLCRDIMKTEVVVCEETDTVRRCAELMRDRNVGFIPVVDPDRRVTGLLTDRDVAVRVVAAGKPLHTQVQRVMTRELVTCSPHDTLRAAEEAMAEARKSRLLVLDDAGRCAGVISLSDIGQAESRTQAGRLLHAVTRREAAAR
jgi:CBS domain-containing protein